MINQYFVMSFEAFHMCNAQQSINVSRKLYLGASAGTYELVSIGQVSVLFMTSHCSTEVQDKIGGLQMRIT